MKFYHSYIVEHIFNQEAAVIGCTTYSGTEKGIVLHSAQQTPFISEEIKDHSH